MKCQACTREIGLRRTCPYCDHETPRTLGTLLKNGTKVLLCGIQWKAIAAHFCIIGIVVALMVIAGRINTDIDRLQWAALKKHGYWLISVGFLIILISGYKSQHAIPEHSATRRVLKWVCFYGIILGLSVAVLFLLRRFMG